MSESFQPRTRETHAAQCASLGGVLHDHFATTFGLHRDSILNTWYFHVTEGLVPDVMHDVLEGILPLETKKLLQNFIYQGVISTPELNEAIESFTYGRLDSCNEPSPTAATTLSSKQTGILEGAYLDSVTYCVTPYI